MPRVVVLGTGGSDPPPGRAGPALLLDLESRIVLVDCGELCVERLRLAGYTPCEVDEVIVTHTHFDHFAGVFSLAVARSAEGCRRLVVRSSESVLRELQGVLRLPRSVELVLKPLSGESIGAYRLELRPVRHTIETYGVALLEGEEALAVYTSDTMLEKGVVSSLSAPRVKLLIAEATLPDNLEHLAPETGHMTVSHALRLREALGAEALIPVHLTPSSLRQLQSHRRLPPGVILASDATSVTV